MIGREGALSIGLPFSRPNLSQISAFVGEEHDREKREREERGKQKADRVQREVAREKVEQQHREETLSSFLILCEEMSRLVQRLLSEESHDAALEIITAAIYDGHSPLASQLRLFWAKQCVSVSAWSPVPIEARQAEAAKGGSTTAFRRRGAVMNESMKSRAQKTELFTKLNIRKMLCAPLQDRDRRGGWSGSARKSLAGGREEEEELRSRGKKAREGRFAQC